jgi:hypothetical protein
MPYYRKHSYRKPQVRAITVKYAGECACCGGIIPVGAIADYYPVGTIAGVNKPMIAHLKAMEGNSVACSAELKRKAEDKGLNDYAGDGLDTRWEDDCKDACGL